MNRIRELTPALLTTMDDPEHAKHAAVIDCSGGQVKADEELQKHVQWYQEVRGAAA